MLSDLQLDVPVYVVTINKTESEDIVVFDRMSTYHDKKKGDDFRPHTYVLRKMTVYYKNKKGKVITRTVKASNISGLMLLSTKKISGYTPYKAKITYTKMTKKEKKVIMNPLF